MKATETRQETDSSDGSSAAQMSTTVMAMLSAYDKAGIAAAERLAEAAA